MYSVYLLECSDGSIYTGIAKDVEERFQKHKNGTGAKYTRGKGVRTLLHIERYRTKSRALKREAEIKKWPRQRKLSLVQGAHASR